MVQYQSKIVLDWCFVFLTRLLDSRYPNQSHLYIKTIKNTLMLHLIVNFTTNFNKIVTNCVLLLYTTMVRLNFRGNSSVLKCLLVNTSQHILCEIENGNWVLKTKQYNDTYESYNSNHNTYIHIRLKLTLTTA
jgi:hypothetical protein